MIFFPLYFLLEKALFREPEGHPSALGQIKIVKQELKKKASKRASKQAIVWPLTWKIELSNMQQNFQAQLYQKKRNCYIPLPSTLTYPERMWFRSGNVFHSEDKYPIHLGLGGGRRPLGFAALGREGAMYRKWKAQHLLLLIQRNLERKQAKGGRKCMPLKIACLKWQDQRGFSPIHF